MRDDLSSRETAEPALESVVGAGATPYRFTVAQVEAMIAAGVFGGDDKFELIDGEIIAMNAKYWGHERLKSELVRHFIQNLSKKFRAYIEASIFLNDKTFIDPDISILPTGLPTDEAAPGDVLLLVEVADSTLRLDLTKKAPKCGRAGVPTLWVVDVERRITHIHTEPSPEGYLQVRRFLQDDVLPLPAALSLIPPFSIASLLAT
jgi:Uma2 family endonuclease